LVLLVLGLSCRPAPAAPPPSSKPATRPYLLHVPGVSGESIVDHTLLRGLRDGGLDAEAEIFDWTEHDPGVPALQAIGRNKQQAQKIDGRITVVYRADQRKWCTATCNHGVAV